MKKWKVKELRRIAPVQQRGATMRLSKKIELLRTVQVIAAFAFLFSVMIAGGAEFASNDNDYYEQLFSGLIGVIWSMALIIGMEVCIAYEKRMAREFVDKMFEQYESVMNGQVTMPERRCSGQNRVKKKS